MLPAGQGLKPHVDERIWGDTWVLACGNYEGGVLHLDQAGSSSLSDCQASGQIHSQTQSHSEDSPSGRPIRKHLRWVRLPQNCKHWASKVTSGCRYSIVLYSPVGFEKALSERLEWKKSLEQDGYKLSSHELECVNPGLKDHGGQARAMFLGLKPGASVDAQWMLWADRVRYSVEELDTLSNSADRPRRLLLVPSTRCPLQWPTWREKLHGMAYLTSVQFEDVCRVDVLARLSSQGHSEAQALEEVASFRADVEAVWPQISSTCPQYEEALPATQHRTGSGDFFPFSAVDERDLLKILHQTHERMGHPNNEQFIQSCSSTSRCC